MTYTTEHGDDAVNSLTLTVQERVRKLIHSRLGPGASIEFMEDLAGGYTEASVAKCDVAGGGSAGLDGQYIVKTTPLRGIERQSTAHEHFLNSLDVFAEQHVPKLVLSAEDDLFAIDLYEIAGGGLRGVHAAEVAGSAQFRAACETVSHDLLAAQLVSSTGRKVMTALEVLEAWLGAGFLSSGRGRALREARQLAGADGPWFHFSGQVLPDPLSLLAEENELTRRDDIALLGVCHGDLHLRNILLDRTRQHRGNYWLIDVNWSSPTPLLYDQAYLETAALLTVQARRNRRMSSQVLLELDEVDANGILEVDDELFVEVARSIRRGAESAMREHQPNRKDSLDYQYLLARLGAALNYASKAMADPERITAYNLAAWTAKLILTEYHEAMWFEVLEQRPARQASSVPARAPSSVQGAPLSSPNAPVPAELVQRLKLFTASGAANGFDRFLVVENDVLHPAMAHLAAQRWSAVVDLNPESEISGLAGLAHPEAVDHQILRFGLNDVAVTPGRGVVPWLMADGWGRLGEQRADTFRDWRRQHLPLIRRLFDRQSELSPNRAASVLCLTAAENSDERADRVLEVIEEAYEQVDRMVVAVDGPGFAALVSALGDARTIARVLPPATMPGKDGPVSFERDELARLSVDLEMLHSQTLSAQLKDEPVDEFWRGRPANWLDLDQGLDVPRDIQAELSTDITAVLQKQGSATLELFHSPGAGGTTLARRIAWGLHRDYPVVLVRRYSQDTVERIDDIYRRTGRSVLVVTETADLTQSERENLYHRLHQWNTPAVVLWVTRTNRRVPGHHKYHLMDPMSPGEASEFRQSFIVRARDDRARAAVNGLRPGNVPSQQLSPFFFGLSAFATDFAGTRGYVESHLHHLDERRLRVAKYLALVTRYAQNGLPYPLVRRWLTGKWGDLAASNADYQEDLRTVLGEDLRHLVVDDHGELRLLHPFVAEHVLAAALEPEGERRWESRLADTAVEFIGKVCGHLGSDNAQTRRILQDLFIRRNQWSGGSSPSAARFAELIHQVPVRDEAYRIFKELTRKCPSEPHFWNHMGRYHIHEMKYGYPDAQEYLLKAIELSGRKDSLHFHSLGMVRRLWVKHLLAQEASDTGRTQEALDTTHDIYQGALDAFADGRRLDSEDEHSYVTPVQMIVDVLNHMVRISPYENFLDLVRQGGDVGGWADEQLRTAEGLLDQLDMALPGHRRSSYHNTCERQLQTLHGNIASLVSQWRSLVTESRSHSGAALVLARAFFREQQQELNSTASEAFRSVVELYDSVFDNRGDLSDSDMRTWFRCYRKLEEYDELEALQRFAVLADYRSTSQEAHYYLYVLRFMRWLRNEEQNQQEVERYLTDSKRLARDGRRQYSYEWVGVGAPTEDGRLSPPRLVHFTELGERRPEPELWEHSDKLLRMTGVIKEIEGPQSGWITVGDGRMAAFFVPKDKFRRHSDINQLVEFYLGFSYEGLRAWSVDFASPAAVSHRPVPAPRSNSVSAAPTPAARATVVPQRPDMTRPQSPQPRAEHSAPVRTSVSAASAGILSRAKEMARHDEEDAYRFLIRSMLLEDPDGDAITSLRLGALLQETFGRQSYARVLAGGKLRGLLLRLGFRLESAANGQFAVVSEGVKEHPGP
ncbi:P-loop NTPase [Streptomyces sp. NPDC003470]|uniref:P-loop NTPase n=1 Tax=unclassified Streptomyces TaxID=2593676 RepID=UPI0036657542